MTMTLTVPRMEMRGLMVDPVAIDALVSKAATGASERGREAASSQVGIRVDAVDWPPHS